MRVKHLSRAPPTYSKLYVNKNRFRKHPGANGVKTGWTTLSDPCLFASATRHGKTMIGVVIDSPPTYNDTARRLNLRYAAPR